MRYDNAIVVVVYNKKIEDSATLNTLVEHDFFNSKLVIHNNGPESITLKGKLAEKIEAKFKCVELINSLNNLPLSMLYNDFIRNNEEAGRFIILDDDSTITEAFVRAVNYNEDDMELPRIISRVDGVTYYPIEAKKLSQPSVIWIIKRPILSVLAWSSIILWLKNLKNITWIYSMRTMLYMG